MRPSFWKAPVSALMFLASILCLSFPKQSYALGLTDPKTNLEIGSFNIQVFGESKVNKPFIRSTILSIISRYDIIFIQEIRDDKNLAIFALLKELKATTGRNYHALVSPRMGRGEMKEQYAYFFDADLVDATDSYVFDDAEDEFAREPYIARFKGMGREFTLAGIHIAPTNVRGELKGLGKVHRDIVDRYRDNSAFIMGDFNADCIYYKPIEGFDYFDSAPKLLIGNEIDTTVSPASCTYDRILGFGDILEHASEGNAFNFMNALGIDLASSKLVSDHYPVEFTITGESGHAPIQKPAYELPHEIDPNEVEVTICGVEPYSTPAGYCFGGFEDGKKRVPASCCSK